MADDERILVYFTDGRNPPRWLDVSDLAGVLVDPVEDPAAPSVTQEESEDLQAVFFFWEEVPRATGYNLYIDGELFNDSPVTTTHIQISPWPLGEGVFNAYITAVAGTFESGPSPEITFSMDFSLRFTLWDESENTENNSIPTTGTYVELLWAETNNSILSTNLSLPVPADFDVLAGEDDAVFSWSAPGGSPDGYNVYLDSGAGYVKHNAALILGTEYVVDGGLAADSYNAYAVAVFDGAESDPSDIVAFTLPVSRVPQNLTGDRPSPSQIDLNWDDLDTIFDSYTAYVKNLTTGLIEQTLTDLAVSQASATGLDAETDYECWVVSVKDGVDSADSGHVIVPPEINDRYIYYINSNEIFRKSLETGVTEQLTSDGALKRVIDIDVDAGYLFSSAHGSGGTVRRYDLEGNNLNVLRSSGFHHGMNLDKVNQKVYHTYGATNNIDRMNYDGSSLETAFGSHGSNPDDIVIDTVNSYLFHNSNNLSRFDFPSGANRLSYIPNDASFFAVNPTGQVLFYRDVADSFALWKVDYDGSNATNLGLGGLLPGINYVNNDEGAVLREGTTISLYSWDGVKIEEVAQLDHTPGHFIYVDLA